ncbi:YagK/YfjJ domain-containing protein [Comamonas terrigena]|uniref:YagK/YfjJ domain-containing protein n=1 Tax=Comamonas terrigena TaxID=32013 RepID=UPI0028A25963|nr:inovirus-type Gp2 protein [Comamonas terrigena]
MSEYNSEIGSQHSLHSVKSQLLIQRDFEEDENCIPNTCSKSLSESCSTILEWCVRSVHVPPFPENKYNDKFGMMQYQSAMMVCIHEVGLKIFQDRDIEDDHSMVLPFIVREIIGVVESWLLLKEEEDSGFLDFVNRSHWNHYKIMSRFERGKLENYANELSTLLREKLMSTGFREKVHSFKKNSLNRYKQVMRVVEQAFCKHSSVLLVRLDWGFKRRIPDLRGKFSSAENYDERFQYVNSCRLKMLNVLRKMFGTNLVFFVWKIECGSVRGLHIHWMIGLNGAKHQDRINVPKNIAAKWDQEVADENAYTWNLNASQQQEDAILRVIEYSDPLIWRIVGGYADYLTKVDYLVRHRTPKGNRSFGCSKLKTESANIKKGRKRSKKTPVLEILKVRRPLAELRSQMSIKVEQ